MSIEIQQKIVEWGEDKGIVYHNNAVKQYLKFVEEKGELAREILRGDVEAAKMELGDCIVTVTLLRACIGFEIINIGSRFKKHQSEILLESMLLLDSVNRIYNEKLDGWDNWWADVALIRLSDVALALGSTFEECAELAYNKISKRKGSNVDGVFVKAEEPKVNFTVGR